jgi:PAS domain S-box-containing protein
MKPESLPYISALLVVMTVLAIVGILDQSERERFCQVSRARVLDHLSATRARLEGALNARLFLTQGIAAQVSTRPEMGEAEFAKVAPVILAGRSGIRAIQLAKGTVVSHIYPLEGNSEAMGLRLLEVPEQRAAAQRALETGTTVVAGPVNLVQGGVAFVSRTPIYLIPPKGSAERGRYWGLTTILIDTETVLREAGLFDHAGGLQYSLRGKDGLGAQGAMFSGDPATFEADPVLLDVSLPNGGWQLAAIPVGGWSSLSPRVWTLRISGALLAVVASALAFVWMRHQAGSRDQQERLQLLLEVTQRLTACLALKTVLSAIAEAAAVVFKGEVAFRLVDGDDLVLMGATTVVREKILKERLRIGESLSGHVAATGQPLIVADSTADARLIPEHRASVLPHGMATMCIPIRLGSTVLATLAVYRERGYRFGQRDLAHAMRLADQAAIAIKNARLFEAAEEALRTQRQFLRQVIDVDANIIFAKDRQGRFTLVNQAMADVYGATVENLVGKTDADFNPNAEEVAYFRRIDLEVMDTLKERSIPEGRVTDAQGRVRWMQTVKRPIIGKDGRASQVLGSATDITERKRAEDALHASERTLRQLVDILPIAVYVCDASGVIERFNKRVVELWGREPTRGGADRFGGSYKLYTVDGSYLPHSAGPMAQVLRTGIAVSNQEFVSERPDGSRRTAIVNIIPLLDSQGKVTGAIGCLNDITERKQAELEVQQQRQLLAHLTRVATLGELSGALAHELSQPLTSILTNAQAAQRFLARESVDLGEVRDILKDIVDDDRRAGAVIRRWRTLLRNGETQLQPLDVNDVTNEVLRLAHNELMSHRVTVTAQLTAGLPAVRGDRVGLQQVLLNLIVNACDAMKRNEPARRHLTVTTALDGEGAVEVAIADCGGGIPADAVERLFEPFFTTKEHGLGLGLAICRSIVTAHGGRLWVTNNADRGATFCFTLVAQRAAVHRLEEEVRSSGHE